MDELRVKKLPYFDKKRVVKQGSSMLILYKICPMPSRIPPILQLKCWRVSQNDKVCHLSEKAKYQWFTAVLSTGGGVIIGWFYEAIKHETEAGSTLCGWN